MAETPFRLRLPATPDSIPEFRHAVGAYVGSLGVMNGQLGQIAIGVTEAVANSVRHGYPTSGPPGYIEVIATPSAGYVDITVRDDGCGPERRSDNPGLGFGLPLMMEVSERFRITEASTGGTQVKMRFNLL